MELQFCRRNSNVDGTLSSSKKNVVQGINDFCVFATVAMASLSSGKLLHLVGWNAVNYALYPMIGVALMLLAWLALRKSENAPA